VNLALEDSFLRLCGQLGLQNYDTSLERFWRSSKTVRNLKKLIPCRLRRSPRWPPFECILSVRVFDERPHAPEIVVFRPLR
jgi:hypothetical protein